MLMPYFCGYLGPGPIPLVGERFLKAAMSFILLSHYRRPTVLTAQYLCKANMSAHRHKPPDIDSVARRESPAAGFDPLGGVKQEYTSPEAYQDQSSSQASQSRETLCAVLWTGNHRVTVVP